jgi:hypothetical protein
MSVFAAPQSAQAPAAALMHRQKEIALVLSAGPPSVTSTAAV